MSYAVLLRIVLITVLYFYSAEGCKSKCHGCGYGLTNVHHGLSHGHHGVLNSHHGLGSGLSHNYGYHKHRSLGGFAGQGQCLAKHHSIGLGCHKKQPCLGELKHKCDLIKHKCDLLKHKCCTKNHHYHKFNKGCHYYDDESDSPSPGLGHGQSHPLLQSLHDALDRRYTRWNSLCDRVGKTIPITI